MPTEKPAASVNSAKAAEDKPAEEKRAEPKTATASGTAYLNTSGGPLVFDKLGHQVAAGEWTPEVNLDKIGQAARRAGHLQPRSAL
jgi:hypothetical protein